MTCDIGWQIADVGRNTCFCDATDMVTQPPRLTLQNPCSKGKPLQNVASGFSTMLVGYMRISTSETRQSTDLQRDALVGAGVDPRDLHSDVASVPRSNDQG